MLRTVMMRVVLSASLLAGASIVSASGSYELASAKNHGAKRDLRRRQLVIDDASATAVPELHVAGGVPTVITFPIGINEDASFLPDSAKDIFFEPVVVDRTATIVPKRDLGSPVPLRLTLADGTVLSFKAVTSPRDVDVQVDVTLALNHIAPPDSLQALRQSVAELHAQLDECQSNEGAAGAQKIAALILAQDAEKPQTFERIPVRGGDRQARLLVQMRWKYALFGLSYVVLTVENRDPVKTWSLARATVSVEGSGSPQELKVVAAVPEFRELPPDGTGRVVVVFPTPERDIQQHYRVVLTEREGNRHVSIGNLEM